MVPFLVLVIATLVLRTAGAVGVGLLNNWIVCLRAGLAMMFVLTASAHWGRRRRDLILMVPRTFPRRDLIVTITGVLELAGAVGLLIPPIAPIAAACLAALLIAIFPANARAARERLAIGGKPATPLPIRTLLQIVFIAALIVAGFPGLLGSIAR